METLDIAIVIIAGVAGLSCLRAGFTRSVWGIAAMSAGAFVASQVWKDVTPFLLRFIKQEPLAKWISIIAIVAAVSIVIDMVFSHIQKVVERGVFRMDQSYHWGCFWSDLQCYLDWSLPPVVGPLRR